MSTNARKVSRRQVLAGALSAVTLTALEACQRRVALESTPGVTPTVRPGVTPGVKPSATATVAQSPTPTAANSPTPKPTKTPWPTATPAHYTRPSKLGLVIQRFSSAQIMDVIEAGQPKVVKIIDDLG